LTFGFFSLWGLEFHTYKDALILQKESGKIIMLDVIRTDCHYCEDMKKNVFDDKKMSQWLEERFIPVQINLDKETPPLGIKVYFTPSFFFVNSKQEIIKKIPGSWGIEDFKDLTKNIIKD
jgi:thioredoxin-related protein